MSGVLQIRLGHYLGECDDGPIIINKSIRRSNNISVVTKLSRILLDLDSPYPNSALPRIQESILCNRNPSSFVVLCYLEIFWSIGIEVVLPKEVSNRGDLTVQRQRDLQCRLYHFRVESRERTRKAHADLTNNRI